MAPKWRRMYSISPCFFSCASLFSLRSWYDILRVPINLGSRVSAFFPWNLPSIKNIQFEWSDSNCALHRKLVTTCGHKYSICFQLFKLNVFGWPTIFNLDVFKSNVFDVITATPLVTSKSMNLNVLKLNINNVK